MIVIDASAVLEILSLSPAGIKLEASLDGIDIHAPHLIDLEVLNVLRRWTFAALMSPSVAEQAVRTFLSLQITRHPHIPFVGSIWALRHNLTSYDASYLVLARALGAELMTMDGGLRKMAARRRRN